MGYSIVRCIAGAGYGTATTRMALIQLRVANVPVHTLPFDYYFL
jgi:hypothetical protein